eukprot:TRINITY_DN9190_c0_g1_i1.p1 TRINITY_DN9190_c0_g1~~TRINITY_DN9190_c0_g1_i1.p1  ORF type:complete len:250 (+),score=36.29 TRINITY_DN9190_c0_g1_i1:586-1335(+)
MTGTKACWIVMHCKPFHRHHCPPSISIQSSLLSFFFSTLLGPSNYAVISISDKAAVFQQWSVLPNNQQITLIDIGSYPNGYACDVRYTGVYSSNWDQSCGVGLCGISDPCTTRSQLLHGLSLNDRYLNISSPSSSSSQGLSFCPSDTVPTGNFFGFGLDICSDGREWNKNPLDCVNQGTRGDCFFCKGIANGVTVSMCLMREGSGCNQIFDSNAAKAFCNLEFECTATVRSKVGFGLVVGFIVLLLRLS